MKWKPASIQPKWRGSKSSVDGWFVHSAITCTCPFCSETVLFKLPRTPNKTEFCFSVAAVCPACSKSATFTVFYPQKSEQKSVEPVGITIFPSHERQITPLALPADFPERIEAAIRDAENLLKAGFYGPSIAAGGRALEGIFKNLTESNKTLNQMIEDFVGTEASSQPLRTLAHAIREGRNAGAHFDEVIEADEESASTTIDLLHYLVTYYFILPHTVEDVMRKFK